MTGGRESLVDLSIAGQATGRRRQRRQARKHILLTLLITDNLYIK
jgi:hypothetical protein